jgi:hypothetical protein
MYLLFETAWNEKKKWYGYEQDEETNRRCSTSARVEVVIGVPVVLIANLLAASSTQADQNEHECE